MVRIRLPPAVSLLRTPHDIGGGLADGIPQGEASGSQFRTAPLWGIGKRIFFYTTVAPQTCCKRSWHMAVKPPRSSPISMAFIRQQQNILDFLRGL